MEACIKKENQITTKFAIKWKVIVKSGFLAIAIYNTVLNTKSSFMMYIQHKFIISHIKFKYMIINSYQIYNTCKKQKKINKIYIIVEDLEIFICISAYRGANNTIETKEIKPS